MNKAELVDFIANQNKCSKTEAEKAIDLFTNGVIGAASEGNDVSLIGFGNFTINAVEARAGINPKTKAPIQIGAYNQVRFKVGQKLKDAANSDTKGKVASTKDKSDKENASKAKGAKAKK
jgi:DNA-binding protein HU-beta